jgi:hypothetical protein
VGRATGLAQLGTPGVRGKKKGLTGGARLSARYNRIGIWSSSQPDMKQHERESGRETAMGGGSPERLRPAARCPGGRGRSSRPPPAGGTSGEARDCWERAVLCGAVEVAELDSGHGSEGDVV